MSVAPLFMIFGGIDMADEKLKDMSNYIYVMHIMENCEELNTVVKNDLKGIKKYISSNLNLATKNVAYDAN